MGTHTAELEAERAGQRHATSVSSGSWFDPRRGEITLGDYLTGWLAARQATGRHGGRYSVEAVRMGERYIRPGLGKVFLVDLTPARVRRWYDDLVARFGKPGLVPAKSSRLLHAALGDAVRDELIARSPAMERSAGVERSPEESFFESVRLPFAARSYRRFTSDPPIYMLVSSAQPGGTDG